MKDIWKYLQREFKRLSKNVKIPKNLNDFKSLDYADKLIALNIGVYVLYKVGIPSRSLYDNLFAVREYTMNPLNFFLSNFFHRGIVHLGLNCWAIKNIFRFSNQFFNQRVALAVFLLCGTLSAYSASDMLKNR